MKAIHTTWGEVEILKDNKDGTSQCKVAGQEMTLSNVYLKPLDAKPVRPDSGTKGGG